MRLLKLGMPVAAARKMVGIFNVYVHCLLTHCLKYEKYIVA